MSRHRAPFLAIVSGLFACGSPGPTDQGDATDQGGTTDPPLAIQTSTLPEAVSGEAYSFALSASGGDGTYTWSVEGGSLPSGFELSVEGRLAGSTTEEGSHAVTLGVSSGGQSAEQGYSLTVTPPPSVSTSPGMLDFAATVDEAAPPSQSVEVWNGGGGTLPWSITTAGPWLSVTPDTGSSTGEVDEVIVTVDHTGLEIGHYYDTMVVAGSATSDSLPVRLAVGPAAVLAPLLVVDFRVLYSVPDTGGARTDLSSAHGLQVTLAEWSPRGSEAAVLADPGGVLHVIAADGSTMEPVSDVSSPITGWPAWAPDGSAIAFNTFSDVYVVDRTGVTQVELTPGTHTGVSPHWSPDGQWIVYSGTNDAGSSGLFRVRPDGSDRTPIVSLGADAERVVRWSPRGDLIAFDDQSELWVVAPDGSGLRPLTSTPGEDDWHPRWSPDGEEIAFHVDNGPYWAIGILDVASATILRTIGHSSIEGLYPAWSPDGSRVAFALGTDIVVGDAGTGSWSAVSNGTYVSWHPGR